MRQARAEAAAIGVTKSRRLPEPLALALTSILMIFLDFQDALALSLASIMMIHLNFQRQYYVLYQTTPCPGIDIDHDDTFELNEHNIITSDNFVSDGCQLIMEAKW